MRLLDYDQITRETLFYVGWRFTCCYWPIAAYGKSRSVTFGGDIALQRAAELAMRDAAALIILQMNKTTIISNLSQARPQGAMEGEPLTKETNLQSTPVQQPLNDST